MASAPRIFVSHSHTDNAFADRLAQDLTRNGGQVWIDREELHDGVLIQRINEALSNADWFILVQTPAAIASRFVQMEVNAALTRAMDGLMQAVIPVVAEPCDRGSVPPLWQTLLYYDATLDYADALHRLLEALGMDKAPPTTTLEANSKDAWTPADLMGLWSRVTPGARRAVGEIARRPESYPYADVLQRLGYSGPTLGGYLSSWGFALRQYPGKADPLVRDWTKWDYRMDPPIAAIIRRLADITEGY